MPFYLPHNFGISIVNILLLIAFGLSVFVCVCLFFMFVPICFCLSVYTRLRVCLSVCVCLCVAVCPCIWPTLRSYYHRDVESEWFIFVTMLGKLGSGNHARVAWKVTTTNQLSRWPAHALPWRPNPPHVTRGPYSLGHWFKSHHNASADPALGGQVT